MQNSGEEKYCTSFQHYFNIQPCPWGVLDSLKNFCKLSSTDRKTITPLKHSFPIFQKMALFHRFSLIFEKSGPHRGQLYLELSVQNSGEGKDCTSFPHYSNITTCPLGVLDSLKSFCKLSRNVRNKITPLKCSFPIFQKMALFHRFSLIFEKSAPHRGQIYIELPMQNSGDEKYCTSFQHYYNIQTCPLGVLDS